MGGFVEAALSFPTVLFTPLLLVIVGYWAVVVVGGAEAGGEGAAGGEDGGAAGGGVLGFVGLGGVPAGVVLSLLAAFGWFASLAGAQLFPRMPGLAVLAAALVLAWLLTRLVVAVLRRLLPTGVEPSRADLVGLTGVIRTQRVTATFGQAEVRSPDGSSAVVQVRQAGNDALRAGSVALLYDFDAVGEFFWVVPADVALHPDPPIA